jgi:hypothetical protein
MILTEQGLALLLFLGVPIRDRIGIRALKTGAHPRRKILTYQRIAVVAWTAALVAGIILRSQVFLLWPGARDTALRKLETSFGLVCSPLRSAHSCSPISRGVT